jgi:hypothetical protein
LPANSTSHGTKRCGAGLVRTRCEYIHVRSAPTIHGGRRSFPAPPRSAWRQPCATFTSTPIQTTRHHPVGWAELRSRLVGGPDFPLRYFRGPLRRAVRPCFNLAVRRWRCERSLAGGGAGRTVARQGGRAPSLQGRTCGVSGLPCLRPVTAPKPPASHYRHTSHIG